VISSEARNLLSGKDHPTTNLAVGYKLRRRNPAIPRALIPRRILQGMSSRVAFRPRRIYAFEFVKHRSFPLATHRIRMTSHECNEFVGTTPTTQKLSFRAEARNLLSGKRPSHDEPSGWDITCEGVILPSRVLLIPALHISRDVILSGLQAAKDLCI